MKLRLLDHLICPLDKTPLELHAWETMTRSLTADEVARASRLGIDPQTLTTEVLTGVLINRARGIFYPIHHGVPRMLTFRTAVAEQFEAKYRERLKKELPALALPNESAMPGEADVLRTFSSEWVNYDWDGQSYWNLTPEAWFKCMRFVLEVDTRPVRDKLALEVGIGVGGVADYMAKSEGCELVGMDLGHGVDVAFEHFGHNPMLHIVQGSAFAPPFAHEHFDFVYSFGVIHHTFSTKTAFDRLAQLPKHGGRLYIWVYSPYDESRTLVRRALMALETVVRPLVWRLPEKAQAVAITPLVPLYMSYQWWQALRGGKSVVRYGVREAYHAARDRFTPRYIHRHTEEEVCGWFNQSNYEQLSCGSQHQKPDFVPIAFTACTGVSGIRR